MFELINWIADNCLHFGQKYGMRALVGLLALTVVSLVVRAIMKIADRNGPKQDV
jgi:hypothetical protein